jgi:RHS repeat-associated protein
LLLYSLSTDIDNQSAFNYQYDAIGNLMGDVQAGITGVTWSVYGKILSITNGSGTITYTYDASGNRISKTVGDITTWYVRDAGGNVMSVYMAGDGSKNSGALTQSEAHVYGSSRLGILNLNVNCTSLTQPVLRSLVRGNKLFELPNHLGNVLVTISDKKLQHSTDGSTVDYYSADAISANDYYAFGSPMPGRTMNTAGYRYGFNGKENDDEIKGTGSSYGAEFWEYDPRIGRRWNRDPITKISESPYSALGNSPTILFDPSGADTINITRTTTTKKMPTIKSGLDNLPSKRIPDIVSTSVSVGIKAAEGDNVFNITDINITIDENGNEKGTTATSTLNLNDVQTFYRTGGHNAKGYLDDRYALAANAPTWLLQYYANKSGDIGVKSALAYQKDMPFTSRLNKIANVAFLAFPEDRSVELIEGFYVRGASTLSNGVYKKTIQTLAYMGEDGSGSMLKLVTAIENQARSAGAQSLEIHGVDIVNAKILSTSKVAAEKFGYSFEQLTSNSIKLTKQLK